MGYKKTYYYLNTTFACGCVCVCQNGYIDTYDTCPIYRKVFKQEKFWKKIDQLKWSKKLIDMVKIDTVIEPF